MAKPTCHNRQPYAETVTAQNGWTADGRRRMVTLPNAMSKDCQQHSRFGAAILNGWDCSGCRWRPIGKAPLGNKIKAQENDHGSR